MTHRSWSFRALLVALVGCGACTTSEHRADTAPTAEVHEISEVEVAAEVEVEPEPEPEPEVAAESEVEVESESEVEVESDAEVEAEVEDADVPGDSTSETSADIPADSTPTETSASDVDIAAILAAAWDPARVRPPRPGMGACQPPTCVPLVAGVSFGHGSPNGGLALLEHPDLHDAVTEWGDCLAALMGCVMRDAAPVPTCLAANPPTCTPSCLADLRTRATTLGAREAVRQVYVVSGAPCRPSHPKP